MSSARRGLRQSRRLSLVEYTPAHDMHRGVKRKTQLSKKEKIEIEISPPGRVPQRRGRRRGDEDAEARSRGASVHARVLPPSALELR